MGEHENTAAKPNGSDQPDHLTRLQNAANEVKTPAKAQDADKAKDNKDNKESDKSDQKTVKLSGPLDPVRFTMAEIFKADDQRHFLIVKEPAGINKEQLAQTKKEEIDKLLQKAVPGYKQLDEQKKEDLRKLATDSHDIGQRKLIESGILKEALKNLAQKELALGEFGPASRAIYSAYVKQLNQEVNHAAKELVHRNLTLPTTKCPIEIPIDDNTKKPYSIARYRQEIGNGKIDCKLPIYANEKTAPGVAQLEELAAANRFLTEAAAKLKPADHQAQAKIIGEQFRWLLKDNPPKTLLPTDEMTDKQAEDYVKRAAPLLDLMIKVNDHARALETLKQLNSGLITDEFITSLKRDFPGDIETKDGQIIVKPDYPTTLEASLDNSRKMTAIGTWLNNVHEMLVTAKKQYALTEQLNMSTDKICFYGRVPEDGKDEATKEEYNYVRHTFTADPVKVTVWRPDGTQATEDRIKVTTSKQYEWAGTFGTYKIGTAKVSGLATANGAPLDAHGEITTFAAGAQLRLSADGIIQARVSDANAKVQIKDDKNTSTDLKPAQPPAEGWVDIMPGYSLKVGGIPVRLENDVRYYKLNDPVAIRSGGPVPVPLMQAKDLPGELMMAKCKEFLSETIPKYVDRGFMAMAAFDGIVYFGAKKGLQVATERALATGTELMLTGALTPKALAATRTSTLKHFFIGGMGEVKEPIKTYGNRLGNNLGMGNLGDRIETGRSLIMSADIAATATKGLPLLGKLSTRWEGVWGHVDPELVKTYLGATTFLGRAKVINEKMLGLADIYFGPTTVKDIWDGGARLRRDLNDVDRQEREAFDEVYSRLKFHQFVPAQDKVAMQLVNQLSTADKSFVETELRNTELSNSVNTNSQLAAKFLNEKAPQKVRLAAALGLLKVNYRGDGSTPDKLAVHKPAQGAEVSVTRGDVEKFLLNYNALSFRKLGGSSLSNNFEECMQKIVATPGIKFRLFDKENEVQDLPLDNPKRVEHIKHLLEVINGSDSDAERKLASSINLVYLGAGKQSAANKLSASDYLLDVFENPASQPNDKLIAGISLLYSATDKQSGTVKQHLAERNGWEIKVDVKNKFPGPDHRYFQPETERVYRLSKEDAVEEASRVALEKTVHKEDDLGAELSPEADAIQPIKDTVTASEVLEQVKHQLADKTTPPAARLALMDLLSQTSQINPVERGLICLEIIKDPSASAKDKASALLDGNKERLAQSLVFFASHSELEAMLQETAASIISDPKIDQDLRTLTVAVLDTIKSSNTPGLRISPLQALNQSKQLAALNTTWEQYQQNMKADKVSTGTQDSAKFSNMYVASLEAKIKARESTPTERFRAASNLAALGAQAIVELTDKQQELMCDTFLQAANVLAKAKSPQFSNLTLLNISAEDRTLAFEAIKQLSVNFEHLNKDKQRPQDRQQVLEILNLPNAGNDKTADPLGETLLKTETIKNLGKIFVDLNSKERELLKSINEIKTPPEKEKLTGELDKVKKEQQSFVNSLIKNINEIEIPGDREKDANELSKAKLAFIEESMQCLVLAAKADNSPKTDAQSIRSSVISLFKDLASMPAKDQPAVAKLNDPLKILALQSLNALRPIEGLDELCAQVLEHEKNPAVREEAEGIQRLLGWKDADAYNAEYLQSKKAIKDAGDNVQLTGAMDYILKRFPGKLLNDDITSKREAGDSTAAKEQQKLLKATMDRLTNTALENTENGKKARSALAYLISENGNPLAQSLRANGSSLAAQGWNHVCHSTDDAVRTSAAPLAALLITHAPTIAYSDCYDVTEGLLALGPASENNIFSGKEIATLLSMSLERELQRSVHDIHVPNFKASQDVHLYLLDKLKAYQTAEQIPLLVAIADERNRTSVQRDGNGIATGVNYADGRRLTVERDNNQIIAFSFIDKEGNKTKWVKDQIAKAFFSEDDLKEKKNPWNCEVNLLNYGNFIIKDAPNALAVLPRDNSYHRVETAGLESGKIGKRSPGGTLTGQFGSQTIYTRDGAQVVEINLGAPGKPEEWKQTLPNGAKVIAPAEDSSHIWAQVTYPDGIRLSQLCDAMGRGIGLRVKSSDGTAADNDQRQDNEFLRTAPAWTYSLGVPPKLSWTGEGFDRDNYAFYRVDAPEQRFENGRTIRYETRIETNGSVVTDRLSVDRKALASSARLMPPINIDRKSMDSSGHIYIPVDRKSIDSSGCTITPIIRNAGNDDSSDHPMPIVRDLARNMLAQAAEDTHNLRGEAKAQIAKADTAKSAKAADLEGLATRLITVLDNRKSTSEEVCKAIFTAGLATPIKEENDPRRALFNQLLSNEHERVRLAAAHMLFEQSIYRQDRRTGALELANIANAGSLLGYRLDAQRTIDNAKQNIEQDRHKSDPTIRLALGLQVGENSLGVITSLNDLSRSPMRKLLADERSTIRLLAAKKLLNSNIPADKRDAAEVICKIARQGNSVQIRDQALNIIYSKDFNDRVQDALGHVNETKELLLSTLEKTPATPLAGSAITLAPGKEHDRAFNERYDAVKLAIGASQDTYVNGFDRRWITQNPDYVLLDQDARERRIKEKAEEELSSWSKWRGYEPDYDKAAKVVHEQKYTQLLALIADTGLSFAQEQQLGKPGAAERAQRILAHLALTERGAMGKVALRAIADKSKGTDIVADKMAPIASLLLCQPMIDAHMRGVVFKALKERGLKSNSAAIKAQTAETAARGLATEFMVMPKDINDPKFADSETLVIDLLTHLNDGVHYQGNHAAIKALAETSPSEKVRAAAAEFLKSGQSKDATSLKGNRSGDDPTKKVDKDNGNKSANIEKSKRLLLPELDITGIV